MGSLDLFPSPSDPGCMTFCEEYGKFLNTDDDNVMRDFENSETVMSRTVPVRKFSWDAQKVLNMYGTFSRKKSPSLPAVLFGILI